MFTLLYKCCPFDKIFGRRIYIALLLCVTIIEITSLKKIKMGKQMGNRQGKNIRLVVTRIEQKLMKEDNE